jgi:diguanylate cyclase (GGDEF)-like protein
VRHWRLPNTWPAKQVAEIAVAPFFRMGSHIGLLSAAALRGPFTDLDNKFIRLFGGHLADRISGLLLQRKAMEILTARATTDTLTGLLNRGAIIDRLASQFALSKRTRQPLSVILLDVDFFKKINDTHGHQAGDDVLCEVSRRLLMQTRQEDGVGRYGGEEFLVVLYPCGEEEAARTAERIRASIEEQPCRIGEDDAAGLSVTASLGVSTVPRYGETTKEALIKRADDALYRSKAEGRNRVTVGKAST